MSSVYIAALIATMISVFILVIIIIRISKKDFRRLLCFGLVSLPASYIAFAFVRTPLDNLIRQLFNLFLRRLPLWYYFIVLLYAPITEELMKLLPLVIPIFRRNIRKDNRIAIGMTIGLGFGIGEMWLVASWFARDVSISGYHWYQLYGYIFERVLSVFSQGVFTVVAIRGLGNKFIKYMLYAMGLHALSNFPIILFHMGFIRVNKIIFQNIMTLYLVVFVAGLGFILVRALKKDAMLNNLVTRDG
jgi:uncharacterized membrane protein YhfC